MSVIITVQEKELLNERLKEVERMGSILNSTVGRRTGDRVIWEGVEMMELEVKSLRYQFDRIINKGK